MKTRLSQKLLCISIVLIMSGCQSFPTDMTIPEEVLEGISAWLVVSTGRNARAKYEEKYYCYVDEPFTLDLNEPGEEQENMRYEGMTSLFRVDEKTGVIEFTPTDFVVGKWRPLIHIENLDGEVLYWFHLDFEVLKRK